MKRLIAIASLMIVGASAFAADLPKDLSARYEELNKVLAARDAKAFHAFFADDFVNVDASGKTTKREPFLKDLDGLLKSAKTFVVKEKFNKVTKSGDTVAVSFELNGLITHADGSKASVVEIGVDTWKKIKGSWQMIKTVDSKFEVKDLKPKSTAK